MLTKRLLSLALGGTEWIIWLLFLLSILSLGIIIEKFLVLRKKRGDGEKLKQKIFQALKNKDYAAIENILRNEQSSSAKVALEVMRNMRERGVEPEDSLLVAMAEERLSLESRITILGTLGSNAPFVGLFGTVLGIIHAFHSLAMNTKGGPATVMAGISEALVATALGLFVAIPAVAAYNYFVRYIKKIMVNCENFARLITLSYAKAAIKRD
jgi:biopolymer transport protein ExbB